MKKFYVVIPSNGEAEIEKALENIRDSIESAINDSSDGLAEDNAKEVVKQTAEFFDSDDNDNSSLYLVEVTLNLIQVGSLPEDKYTWQQLPTTPKRTKK